MQETNNRGSQQCRIRKPLDAGLRNRDCFRIQFASEAQGNLTRPRGNLDPTSHSSNRTSLDTVDNVSSNVPVISFPGRLFNIDDNEAVIRMIIKDSSPILRHVSRTHCVDLDWLMERINLDSSISIRYVCIIEQLADILTKGPFA